MTGKFNRGKPYHGSNAVSKGKLRGATDTDYFYFLCPQCRDNQILRLLDYDISEALNENPYDDQLRSKAAKGFTLAFKIYCEKCKLTDFVKLSNLGSQCGRLDLVDR